MLAEIKGKNTTIFISSDTQILIQFLLILAMSRLNIKKKKKKNVEGKKNILVSKITLINSLKLFSFFNLTHLKKSKIPFVLITHKYILDRNQSDLRRS